MQVECIQQIFNFALSQNILLVLKVLIKGSLQKKKPKKSLEFSKLSGTPPPKVWKVPKILGFFKSPKNT